ncbi:MAG: exonuclease domain-containing protein [Candidatus Microsaccharimonas sp.]
MFEYPVVFVDIETTGGSYRNSRVLEIAAVRFENGKITKQFSTLLNPETYIPSNITSLTGIHPADVEGKPLFADIVEELNEITKDAVFVAHNVRFDYSFIKQEYAMLGMKFSPKLLCTVRLARALYSTQKGHSLAKLIERHNITVSSRHRALDDAMAMLEFTQIAFNEHGVDLFNEAVARQLKTQSLPPHLDSNQIEAIPNVPGVYIFRDETRLPLYVGKSITLKKRVMSHFQSGESKELKISQQVHHVETINTGSELAALILESKLIKELQPIYNRLLRRISRFAMLIRSEQDGYLNLSVNMGKIDTDTDLSKIYGIYRNRTAAKKKIEEVTRLFNLCPKLMGVEKTNGACFSYSLGKCKGACVGKESSELYNRRVELALEHSKIPMWEYPSAVSVPINAEGESVVVNNWIIQGFLNAEGEMIINDVEPNFDVDEYKIIRRFLRSNQLNIRPYSQN